MGLQIAKSERSDSEGFGRHECKYSSPSGAKPSGTVTVNWTADDKASDFDSELTVIKGRNPKELGGLGDTAYYVAGNDNGMGPKVFVLTPKGRLYVELSGQAGVNDVEGGLTTIARKVGQQVAF